MKSEKPKGKDPSLIGSTLGTPKKVLVQRECSCGRCHSAISKGTECYEVPQLGGPFVNHKRYCSDCFQAILRKTKADLDALFKAANGFY
mgnify:CR=1 FL=1